MELSDWLDQMSTQFYGLMKYHSLIPNVNSNFLKYYSEPRTLWSDAKKCSYWMDRTHWLLTIDYIIRKMEDDWIFNVKH